MSKLESLPGDNLLLDFAPYLQRAEELSAKGRAGEGASICLGVLSKDPSHPEANHFMAMFHASQQRMNEALEFARRTALVVRTPVTLNTLGVCLRSVGDVNGALNAFREAREINPRAIDCARNEIVLLLQADNLSLALTRAQGLLQRFPTDASAHQQLGNTHLALGDTDQAIDCFRHALQLNNSLGEARLNMALAMVRSDSVDEGVEIYQQLLASNPSQPLVLFGIAFAQFYRFNQVVEARKTIDRALEASPDAADLRVMKSYIALAQGEYKQGWELFENRRQSEEWKAFRGQVSPRPKWEGKPLTRQYDMMVYADGHVDETILFARFVPGIIERVPRYFLKCPPEAKPVLQPFLGERFVFSTADIPPPHQYYTDLLSAPHLLGVEGDIATEEPYLTSAGGVVPRSLEKRSRGLRVGIAWQSEGQSPARVLRNIPYRQLRALLDIKGVHFYSLQQGEAMSAIVEAGDEKRLVDLAPEMQNLADMASAMEHLELVIACDGVAAHLAGALGRPVWILLPKGGSWVWGCKGEKSPWYQSARLFRNASMDSWDDLVTSVAGQLEALPTSRKSALEKLLGR